MAYCACYPLFALLVPENVLLPIFPGFCCSKRIRFWDWGKRFLKRGEKEKNLMVILLISEKEAISLKRKIICLMTGRWALGTLPWMMEQSVTIFCVGFSVLFSVFMRKRMRAWLRAKAEKQDRTKKEKN